MPPRRNGVRSVHGPTGITELMTSGFPTTRRVVSTCVTLQYNHTSEGIIWRLIEKRGFSARAPSAVAGDFAPEARARPTPLSSGELARVGGSDGHGYSDRNVGVTRCAAMSWRYR